MPRHEGWWPLKKKECGLSWVPQLALLPFSFPQPLGTHIWYRQALLKRNCIGLISTRAETLGSERPCSPGGRCPNLKVPRDLAVAEGAGTRSSYRICRAQSKMQMRGVLPSRIPGAPIITKYVESPSSSDKLLHRLAPKE